MWAGAGLAALLGAGLSAVAFCIASAASFLPLSPLGRSKCFRLFSGFDILGGTAGIFLISANDPLNMNFLSRIPYYEIILALIVLAAGGTFWLERSRLGQYAMALREDEDAAEASGVRPFDVRSSLLQ